jgi:hypothetical protein
VEHGTDYWSGPDSLPPWLPPGHDGFCTRSNRAAMAAGLITRPWQETLADTLADERRQGLERRRKAGLAPATEAGSPRKSSEAAESRPLPSWADWKRRSRGSAAPGNSRSGR